MPCLNEAETIGSCISKANTYISNNRLEAEVLIADNGSSDGSQSIARELNARVIEVPERGYGSALQEGIKAARGRHIIMGDADDSYDFSALDPFVERLRQGCDLVMGNRFRGGIAPGAMPPMHRYFGNPVLTGIGRLFFRGSVGDFHCGLRGFNKEAIDRLDLQAAGMEFASEMVVKASLVGYEIAEVPTTLSPDGRSRPPHLRSWRDGWRHLRFLLMFAPRWLFLYPGLALIVFGLLINGLVLPGPLRLGSVIFDVHTLLVGMGAIIVGSQVVITFFLVKQYATKAGFLPLGPRFDKFTNIVTLERALIFGILLCLIGISGLVTAFFNWSSLSFGDLDYSKVMRLVVPSVTTLAVGVQVVSGGFFWAILNIQSKRH